MKKLLLFSLSSISLFHAYGEPILDLSKFKDLTKNQESGQVFADSFDRGNKGWTINEKFKIIPNAGINGSAAMFYERTNPQSYPLLDRPIELRADRIYRVTFSVKLSELKQHGAPSKGEFGAVEYMRNGRFLGGGYSNNKKYDLNSIEWQDVSFTFQPGEGVDKAYVRLYLQREYTGKIWWDNLRIEEVGSLNAVVYNLEPKKLQLDDAGRMAFGASIYIQTEPKNTILMVTVGGVTKLFKPNNGVYAGNFEKLPLGKVKAETYLLDLKNKTILAKNKFTFFYSASNKSLIGASSIDHYGRTIVDGKPFLPIGMFGHSLTEKQIKELADSGFNCFLSYWAMYMTSAGGREYNFINVDTCMELFNKYNIKIIFSLKDQMETQPLAIYNYQNIKGLNAVTAAMVKRYKDNPALLAWYISDENPRSEVPALQELRELINGIDPNHFTVTLTYNTSDFPFFASTGDVLCVDAYPIVKAIPTQDMFAISRTLEPAEKLNIPLWFAPQAFNYGLVKAKPNTKEYKEYRWPTPAEIRAMTLTGAIHGAKGFIFYSHSFIFKSGEIFEPGSSKYTFPAVVTAVEMLRDLEPFLLSIKESPSTEISSISSGKVETRGWTNDAGQIRIAIVGLDGGSNTGVIIARNLPNLKSKYGLTVNLGNCKYLFNGKNISSDILY